MKSTITVQDERSPVLASLLFLVWLGIGAFAVLIATRSSQEIPLLGEVLNVMQDHVSSDKAMYSPLAYFVLLSVTFMLERVIPVHRRAFFSASMAQDILWYVASVGFRLTLLAAYSTALYAFYHEYLSTLTIEAARNWHPVTKFVVALLVTDFFRWLAHLIIHKVPAFWAFHAVHHSQTELNLFTDSRVHPVDRIVAGTVKFIPALMLDNALPVILAWAIFETIYPKFYHANVRLHFGPLRYILVTPQSHRVHHGVAKRYHDSNYGFTFSIWDWIFGTQYRDHTVYPETGIPDREFPADAGKTPVQMLSMLGRQLIYPFVFLGKSLRS
jgi:sterol desaturase/sphingolipid hydroxylase (fatty acid hydroxylase superfamily)